MITSLPDKKVMVFGHRIWVWNEFGNFEAFTINFNDRKGNTLYYCKTGLPVIELKLPYLMLNA